MLNEDLLTSDIMAEKYSYYDKWLFYREGGAQSIVEPSEISNHTKFTWNVVMSTAVGVIATVPPVGVKLCARKCRFVVMGWRQNWRFETGHQHVEWSTNARVTAISYDSNRTWCETDLHKLCEFGSTGKSTGVVTVRHRF